MSASRVLALLPDISANKITDLAVRSRSPKKTRTTPQPIDHTGQTPRPSKDEIALWRNSQRQNVCVAMLRQGFHLSFQELLSVLQRFEETRQAGGPDNALWYLPPLQEQPHKLLTLQTHLTCAETAFRT
ncbi:tetratricopeptide repeat protein 29-like, partial [Engraulis encrasicolus]